MPLWSNEEWRARIGSCWCALGRPFNTRFTRCRGKSRGMLTLHQVATMVIMMMLLIAANLGLAATQGHHKMFINMLLFGDVIMEIHVFRLGLILMSLVPIVKICVQMVQYLLPLRAKTSLGQFYVDLTHCFQLIKYLVWMITGPALYAVNSVISGVSGLVRSYIAEPVTKWTESDDISHQGSTRQSLMVVVIMTIQLLVTVSVARSVIFFLLLTSGDVEQNPGPCHAEGMYRIGLFAARIASRLPKGWRKIKKQVASMLFTHGVFAGGGACSFGCGTNFRHKRETRLVAVLMSLLLATSVMNVTLLLRCGDIESNPGPGRYSDLDYNSVDCSKVLGEDDLRDIISELIMVKARFYAIGRALGLPMGELNSIRSSFQDHELQLNDVLYVWLCQKYNVERFGIPTWRKLVEAIDNPSGGNDHRLAKTIALHHPVVTVDERKPNYERELNLLLEKEGYVELTMSKLLITGAAGSGKTCTKHILYKLPPPDERISTELLEQMDRAYVARGIDHDIAYFTESTEFDWIVVHSDDHKLYSMLAETVSKARSSIKIGYHKTVHNSPTAQQRATSSSSLGENNSPPPVQTSQHQPIVHESDGKKLLLKKMSDPTAVGKCIHQVHWIHFLDSGGQSAFHDILPAFVHNISVVIFVLKLSEAMDEQPFDDYYEGGKCIGDTKRSPYQVKEILKSMIQSICSEKNCSKLLIIGTHSDQISLTKESLRDKNATLKSLLHSFVGHDQLDVLCHRSFDEEDILFAINAKDQDEKSKGVAKTIRERIVKSCKYTEPLKIPISWFLLEEDLRVSGMKREHGIINKTECQPIADNLHIARLSDALEYFHSLNIFLYFSSSQLSNLVFTKPQIIVTIVSRFVKLAYKLRGELTNTQFINYSKQGQFTKDLILQEDDIARFIDHNVGFEIEQMIELLHITFVVAPISKGKYFIPCVLDYCPPEDIKKLVSSQSVAPMVIKLPGECVPRGFFCAFTCSLLSQWKLHRIDDEFTKVFKNFIHFDIEGVGYSVAIVDSFFYISVHVFGNCGRKGCRKIQELVKASVKEIITKHNYENNVFRNDSMLFLCPCGKQPDHFAQLIMEEDFASDKEILRLKCAMHNDQHLDLVKEHAVWFTDEQYSKWSEQTQDADINTVQKAAGAVARPFVQQPPVQIGPLGGESLQKIVKEVTAYIPRDSLWKLEKEIDFENVDEQGQIIPRHLGTIAASMIHWEGSIADELGLTQPDRVDIVQGRHSLNPRMQRREALHKWRQKCGRGATYEALIVAFIKADRLDCANTVCQTLLQSTTKDVGDSQTTAGFDCSMSEEEFFIWLKSKGVGEKDCKILSDNGVTPAGFPESDAEDFDDLGLTKFGKKNVLKALALVQT